MEMIENVHPQLEVQKVVGSIPREHTYWKKMYSHNALQVALDKSVC